MNNNKRFLQKLFEALTADDNNNKNTSLHEEKVSFKRNGIETEVSIYFDERGFAVSVGVTSNYNPTEKEELLNQVELLNKQIQEAAEAEDYHKAALLKKERDGLLTKINNNQQ